MAASDADDQGGQESARRGAAIAGGNDEKEEEVGRRDKTARAPSGKSEIRNPKPEIQRLEGGAAKWGGQGDLGFQISDWGKKLRGAAAEEVQNAECRMLYKRYAGTLRRGEGRSSVGEAAIKVGHASNQG